VVKGPQARLCGFRRPASDLWASAHASLAHIVVDDAGVLATFSYSRLRAQEDTPWPRTPEPLAPLIATQSSEDAAKLASGPSALEREGDRVASLSRLRRRSAAACEPRRRSPSQTLGVG